MKQRTKRDLTILVGAIAIIGITAFVNTQLRRGNLAEKYEALREQFETEQAALDSNFLKWELLRATKGRLRAGGKFTEEIKKYDGQRVAMYGFQVPSEDYRDVSEFLLLPIPLECYYCSMPPPRDVLHVQMAAGLTTSIYNEPVLLNGVFTLNEGPDQKFFYQMTDTTLVELDGGELTKKRIQLQHMLGGAEHPDDKKDSMLPPSQKRYTDDKTD
jgi:hypothetical protein